MGRIKSITTSLSAIGVRMYLRLDFNYHFFWNKFNGVLVSGNKKKGKYYYLWEIMQENSSQILQKGDLEEDYILLDLADINAGTGEIVNENKTDYIGSNKVVFGDAEIVISKLETNKGHILLNDKSKKYIGTTELIPYRVDGKIADKVYLRYLLLSKELLEKLKYLVSGKTHHRVLPYELLHTKIFLPSLDIQEAFVKKINPTEETIIQLKKAHVSLQQSIDDVFILNGIKDKDIPNHITKESVIVPLSKINHGFLRCGVKYEIFWEDHKGKLFSKSHGKLIPLKDYIFYQKPETVEKGTLPQKYILIELEDIQSKTGKIINDKDVVTEINSNKIVFGDADFLVSKLRPYLGYTILNEKKGECIGTTELVGFKINSKKANLKFIQYLLLSSNFLEKSRYLMYGKEHPRIHIPDLLNIKIPEVSPTIQEKIAKEIHIEEVKNLEILEKINKFRLNISEQISETLV